MAQEVTAAAGSGLPSMRRSMTPVRGRSPRVGATPAVYTPTVRT